MLMLLVLKPEYSGQNGSIPWLVMPWLLTGPCSQQPRYWICRINGYISVFSNVRKHKCIYGSWHICRVSNVSRAFAKVSIVTWLMSAYHHGQCQHSITVNVDTVSLSMSTQYQYQCQHSISINVNTVSLSISTKYHCQCRHCITVNVDTGSWPWHAEGFRPMRKSRQVCDTVSLSMSTQYQSQCQHSIAVNINTVSLSMPS